MYGDMLNWSANPWLLNIFFLSIRVAAMLFMTPVLFAASIPLSIRVLLILALSVAIAAGIGPEHNSSHLIASGGGALIVASLRELAFGASLAVGILIGFAMISMAGRLLDVQIGFGMAQVFDPLTRSQLPIVTALFNQLGVIFFFLIDAHHTLLRAVAFSVEKFPLGQAWSVEGFALPMLKHVGSLFSLGFALASPVVFCLLLVELSLGVVSRNLPQMNMFVLGVPIKVIVGLATLSVWVAVAGASLTRIHASIFQTWDWMFSTASPVAVLPHQRGGANV